MEEQTLQAAEQISGQTLSTGEQTLYQDIIQEQLKSLDYEQLESIMRLSDFSGENPFPMPTIGDLVEKLLSGELLADPMSIMKTLGSFFLSETFSSMALFAEILVICMIGALLKNASASIGERAASGVGQMVCNYAAVAISIGSFTIMYNVAATAIDEMVSFMQALLPLMVTLLMGSGAVSTGAVMNPVVLGAISIFATVCHLIILPAVFLSCSFFLINSLTENDYIKKLAGFIRKFALFIMGLGVLLFSGLSAVQGMVTVPADTVIAKAAKYSIGNFVPVIGGFAADSLDLIKSCTVVLKSAVGVFGVLAMLFLLMVPLVKIMAAVLIYKIAAIVIEPIGDRNMSDCMNEMGNTMVALALVLFLVALMFLIFITLMATTGRSVIL